MWSGNMPGHGEPYPTQWALNPSAQYLHIPSEQVDWATLAQQWIKMKEEAPQLAEKEQGEAPMDITKDDSATSPVPPAPTISTTQTTPVVPTTPAWPTQIPAAGDTSSAAWWAWSQAGGAGSWAVTGAGYTGIAATDSTVAATTPAFPYTPAAPPAPEYAPPPPNVSGYWTGDVRVKDDTHSWDGRNNKKPHAVQEAVPELDAAKRRQLPAWIREGLEKMEREKQKKAENERLERERQEALLKSQEIIVPPRLDGNGYELPAKSKFDSESSDDEKVVEKDKKETEDHPGGGDVKLRRSRFDVKQPSPPPKPKPVFRTKEQILQAVMTDVRKILTQILMDVTSEEIQKACEEVNRQYMRKAPASDARKTPALSSLTGKLGLGIYGSDSDSEDSSEEKVTNDRDSDQELKEKIERLRSEFAHTEEHIEREGAEQEEREKRQLLHEKRVSPEQTERSVPQVLPQPHPGPPAEKHVEKKVEVRSEEPRSKESKTAPGRGVTESSRARPAERGGGERRRKRESSSSSSSSSSDSSSSSSSSSSTTPPPRRRSRDSHTRKRRRHHSSRTRHRHRRSSSSPSPRRRHSHSRHRR